MANQQNQTFRKIVIVLAVVIVAFIAFMTYSINTSIKNTERLNNIKIIHFPVLENVDKNVVRLDKIKELLLQSIMTAEEELVEETNSIREQAVDAFEKIKTLEPSYSERVDELITEFNNYQRLGAESSLFLQANMDNMDLVEPKMTEMNNALASLQASISKFREYSYNQFTDTLTTSNQSATRNMYMGIAVGVINLFFMGALVFFIRNNYTMLAIIEEQNANLENRVAERTEELAKKTNDINTMLSNMQFGVFTIIADNKVHPEYSAHLETILDTKNIADRDIEEILLKQCDIGTNAYDQVVTALGSIIGEDLMMFDFNGHLLINEMKFVDQEGNTKILRIDWTPVANQEDVVEKVLVIIEDVTALKALELEAQAQREELDIISQILKIAIGKFNAFIESSNKYIDDNEKLIKANTDKDPEVLAALFRNMHTVKGNARTYEFISISDVTHEVEQTYDQLRKDEDAKWDQAQLLEELAEAKSAIKRYETVNNDVLGRKGRSSAHYTDRGVFVQNKAMNEIKTLVSELRTVKAEEQTALVEKLDRNLRRFGQVPLGRLVCGALDSIDSLAKELGKPVPSLKLRDEGLTLDNSICEALKSSFMHIIRNSMDHGIESPEERLKAQKPEAGVLRFQVAPQKDGRILLVISDDGRGLALHKLFEKAKKAGMYSDTSTPPPQEVAELIFNSGLSTAENVSMVSGRGVGMDAVRAFLKEQKASIRIKLDHEPSDLTFTPFKFVIQLPNEQCTLGEPKEATAQTETSSKKTEQS